VADAGLFIGWGEVARGREGQAVESFNDTVGFLGQLQEDGRIESFELCLLDPHGGDLAGFMLLRGSPEQIHAVHYDDDFVRRIQRASLVVDNVGIVHASLDEAIGRQMAMYQEQIGALA
jgi:hypothetical protein